MRHRSPLIVKFARDHPFQLGGLKMHAGGGALFRLPRGEDFSRLPAARSALNHIASATVWPRFGAADRFGMAEFA
ncbi:MAG TPA: hypothetical protein VJ464_12360 [Blastocatellia bacterium]|nr:hypothetical protein [Blastocatellia bacterium]